MRFFLGGVPFGCDNIGDEAILAGTIKILRGLFEGCQIRVSTSEPEETARLHGVECVPLIGFKGSPKKLTSHLADCDAYIWTGATGLSDYPKTALNLLQTARLSGVKTLLLGVGMDSVLNPAFFKLGQSGLKKSKLLSLLTGNRIDVVNLWENHKELSMRKRIARELAECDFISVRDNESLSELRKCGLQAPVSVAGDAAFIFRNPDDANLAQLEPQVREALLSGCENIAVCVSSQRAVRDLDGLVDVFDALLQKPNRNIFFTPMNPLTDYALMSDIRDRMADTSHAFLVKNFVDYKTAIAVFSHCNAVVSSRLHMLILGANVSSPIVGISRGSKIDNFLGEFGLTPAGNFEKFDKRRLIDYVERAIVSRENFKIRRDAAYARFDDRRAQSDCLMKAVLFSQR